MYDNLDTDCVTNVESPRAESTLIVSVACNFPL